jgi:diketogulonate reductase-like aldo/keto reductase
MPRLGLGVFRAGSDTYRAVGHALMVGYRHLDTAAIYRNEADVGRALRDSGVPRSEVFVTTKLWNDDQGYDEALRAFDASLDRLGLDHVDQYLLHWPVQGKRLASWRALERLLDEGRTRSIGVSNFMVHHLEELLAHCKVPPAANQIEIHPFLYRTRGAVVALCEERAIQLVAYSPLTKGRRLGDPRLAKLARKTGRTPAQVLIRWALQHDLVVIPKSSNPARIEENFDVLDWSLTSEQMSALDALDAGLVTAWDPAHQA